MPLRFALFWLPLLFFGYIFLEIAAFIFIGSHIGILFSLCLIVLSSMLGLRLLRGEMRNFSVKLAEAMQQSGKQESALICRLSRCLGAALLIPPGFISSACGALLLIPFVQDRAASFIGKSNFFHTYGTAFSFSGDMGKSEKTTSTIIDLPPEQYHSSDPENSPWRQS